MLEELTKFGWSIEWFSAKYPGAPERSTVNGIRYVRSGSQTSVHLAAYQRYRAACAFDVVIDEINTIPFYTPLYLKCRTIAWINQLAANVWRYESPFPAGAIGKALEPIYLRPYRRTEIITISESSAQSFREIGLAGRIHVIPMAVDESIDEYKPTKTDPPHIIVLGRITKSKRVEHALVAAANLRGKGWKGKLHIVGGGGERYVSKLKRLASKIVGPTAVFHDHVSMNERAQLLRSCSILWMTSVREGWGLVVTEAARHWTPAVVYNVSGLRDSVVDGLTGRVVPQHPDALARATYEMITTNASQYARNAMLRSKSLSWDETGRAVQRLLIHA